MSLAVFAALINNVGLNLQKLAWTHKQNEIKHKYYNYRFIWVVGMIMIVAASVCDFVALAFGPQSVIAPLGSLTMVSNAIVAPKMHGEKLHRHVLYATAIIVLGCMLSVASASHANEVCDINALMGLYWTVRFMLYALTLLAIVTGVMLFIRKAEALVKTHGKDSAEYSKIFKYHRISYAFLSGLLGAQSVLFARSVALLVVASTRGSRFFLFYPSTYLILFSLVACIFLQLYWLNQGLARFESLYNVPTFTATWIVGTVLGGGVFYGEFSQFSVAQAFFFPLGVFLCVIGVMYLSFGSNEDGKVGIIDQDESGVGNEDEDDDLERSGDVGNGEETATRVSGSKKAAKQTKDTGGDSSISAEPGEVEMRGLKKSSKKVLPDEEENNNQYAKADDLELMDDEENNGNGNGRRN